MPIYEFYCPSCHTIYSFWSRRVETEKVPPCPKGGRHRLSRQVSRFAVTSGASEKGEGDEMGDLPMDEAKLERAMTELASQAEGLDEDDPRAAARLMRKLSESTGMEYGEAMQEALRRLEAGEDPDAVEEEMGGLLEGDEEPFSLPGMEKKGGRRRRQAPPARDDTLYEMP
ncbi:MAG: zinc ribbon domain-containing protein [Gemmatimonadota bacterium]